MWCKFEGLKTEDTVALFIIHICPVTSYKQERWHDELGNLEKHLKNIYEENRTPERIVDEAYAKKWKGRKKQKKKCK